MRFKDESSSEPYEVQGVGCRVQAVECVQLIVTVRLAVTGANLMWEHIWFQNLVSIKIVTRLL